MSACLGECGGFVREDRNGPAFVVRADVRLDQLVQRSAARRSGGVAWTLVRLAKLHAATSHALVVVVLLSMYVVMPSETAVVQQAGVPGRVGYVGMGRGQGLCRAPGCMGGVGGAAGWRVAASWPAIQLLRALCSQVVAGLL